jgi:hypothetical protein
MKIDTGTVKRLINANPLRTHLIITNMSNSIAYIAPHEDEYEFYEDNGFPLDKYGLIELSGVDCYKGSFYGITDTDDTDIRVLEL